jgi:quinol monooxygenase YgiN
MPTNRKEIRLIASMTVVPGKENELREVLHGLIGPTRNEPGCRRYQMYESVPNKRSVTGLDLGAIVVTRDSDY